MAQSPLVEGAKKLYQEFEDSVAKAPPRKKVDTSWHDQEVKDANKSFANKQETAKTATKRKVGGAAKQTMMAKNSAPKAGPRKRSTKLTGY